MKKSDEKQNSITAEESAEGLVFAESGGDISAVPVSDDNVLGSDNSAKPEGGSSMPDSDNFALSESEVGNDGNGGEGSESRPMQKERKKPLIVRAAASVKYFLVQTLRRHTKMEYSELLTRGMRSTKGVNKSYPWAYFRLFILFFVLYAVFLLIIRFAGNELFAPAVMTLAAVMFNVPFLLLMFELYPKRDLSFISVLFALLVGGTAACVISQALFASFPSPNVWMKAVYAGFFEELAKAFITVLTIVLSGKRSPLAGFLMGAAVGCGFSVVEDMGYIFVLSNQLPAINLTTIIEVSLSRGATAFCTHTIWTALVGWAYSHFKRHLYNIFNYLVLIAVCGLHICWDLPLDYVPQAFVCAGCVALSAAAAIAIVVCERKAVFRQEGIVFTPERYFEQDRETVDGRHPLYWKHWGRFTMVLGAFLMAVVSVIYCSIPFRETYGTETFSEPKEFVLFMQNGMEFKVEENRPYNSHDTVGDKDKTEVDGVLTSVTQTVVVEGVPYDYRYNVFYDTVDDRYHYMLSSIAVQVKINGAYIKYIKEDLYHGGKLYASFFRINGDVTGFNFESDGDITVFIYDANFVRDLSEPRYVALFATFAGTFGASLICYIALEIKSRRVKKLCSTTTASSAE